jgi:hypothetical protein
MKKTMSFDAFQTDLPSWVVIQMVAPVRCRPQDAALVTHVHRQTIPNGGAVQPRAFRQGRYCAFFLQGVKRLKILLIPFLALEISLNDVRRLAILPTHLGQRATKPTAEETPFKPAPFFLNHQPVVLVIPFCSKNALLVTKPISV